MKQRWVDCLSFVSIEGVLKMVLDAIELRGWYKHVESGKLPPFINSEKYTARITTKKMTPPPFESYTLPIEQYFLRYEITNENLNLDLTMC